MNNIRNPESNQSIVKVYPICVTLFIFCILQETTSTIVFRLLDRVVAAELIPNAITKYIAPYMVHHSLDRDTMLLHYIEVKIKKMGHHVLPGFLLRK